MTEDVTNYTHGRLVPSTYTVTLQSLLVDISEEGAIRVQELVGVKCYLEDKTMLLHSYYHSSCGYLFKVKPVKIPAWGWRDRWLRD